MSVSQTIPVSQNEWLFTFCYSRPYFLTSNFRKIDLTGLEKNFSDSWHFPCYSSDGVPAYYLWTDQEWRKLPYFNSSSFFRRTFCQKKGFSIILQRVGTIYFSITPRWMVIKMHGENLNALDKHYAVSWQLCTSLNNTMIYRNTAHHY